MEKTEERGRERPGHDEIDPRWGTIRACMLLIRGMTRESYTVSTIGTQTEASSKSALRSPSRLAASPSAWLAARSSVVAMNSNVDARHEKSASSASTGSPHTVHTAVKSCKTQHACHDGLGAPQQTSPMRMHGIGMADGTAGQLPRSEQPGAPVGVSPTHDEGRALRPRITLAEHGIDLDEDGDEELQHRQHEHIARPTKRASSTVAEPNRQLLIARSRMLLGAEGWLPHTWTRLSPSISMYIDISICMCACMPQENSTLCEPQQSSLRTDRWLDPHGVYMYM